MLMLAVEPLDLGPDVKALALSLTDPESEEPASGPDAARIWSRALLALAGERAWILDFFSQVDRLREFCRSRDLSCRDTPGGGVAVAETDPDTLAELFERFQKEAFGIRVGGPVETGDPGLELELRERGLDAYHQAYPGYLFCAICEIETGSITMLSEGLWAAEAARQLRPGLRDLSVAVELLM
ncbi:MAG TPA: hypothetical protein VGS20_00420 [Candidatus Acidoferrales bacterium]|nr:hypothetical protein [Candidatus Acidoferrales bacterium]